MQAVRLSPVQRSWMNNPDAFARRMAERAETLFQDGYSVEPGEQVGEFLLHTPKGQQYTVSVLEETCTCDYSQKAEIPQVKCKHLQGVGILIEEQLALLKAMAQQHELSGRSEYAGKRWEEFHILNTSWNDARDEATVRRLEEEEDGRQFMEDCWTEAEIRRDMEMRNFCDSRGELMRG